MEIPRIVSNFKSFYPREHRVILARLTSGSFLSSLECMDLTLLDKAGRIVLKLAENRL